MRPFPRPLGRDGHLPLLSSGWDGFHVSSAHIGTTLANSLLLNTGQLQAGRLHINTPCLTCTSSRILSPSSSGPRPRCDASDVLAGDDAIAMNGNYYTVAEVHAGEKYVIVAAPGDFLFKTGDLLTFYAPDTRMLGTVTVARLFSVDQPDSTRGKKTQLNVSGARGGYDDFNFLHVRPLSRGLVSF